MITAATVSVEAKSQILLLDPTKSEQSVAKSSLTFGYSNKDQGVSFCVTSGMLSEDLYDKAASLAEKVPILKRSPTGTFCYYRIAPCFVGRVRLMPFLFFSLFIINLHVFRPARLWKSSVGISLKPYSATRLRNWDFAHSPMASVARYTIDLVEADVPKGRATTTTHMRACTYIRTIRRTYDTRCRGGSVVERAVCGPARRPCTARRQRTHEWRAATLRAAITQ